MKKRVLLLSLLLLVLIVLQGCRSKTAGGVGPANIVVWGLDDQDDLQGIFSAFQQARPGSSITYKKFNNAEEYESVLINEIAEGEGPDVFYAHNTWFPRHSNKVVPLLSETFTPEMFSQSYVRVASQDFLAPDPVDGVTKIYALPLFVDTLALYYNIDLFELKLPERGKPAPLWTTFEKESVRFIDEDEGTLNRGAIAFGNAENIQYAADIIYSLFLQSQVGMYDSNFKQISLKQGAENAFKYFLGYSKRSNKHFSWSPDDFFGEDADNTENGDEVAFLSGKSASMMAYSDFSRDLKTKLKNVKALVGTSIKESAVGVIPSPQFSGSEEDAKAFASYWGLAVSRTSKIPNTAWDFVRFAGSQPQLQLYIKETGRPTSRRDLISTQRGSPMLDAFIDQLGYADSYRLYDKEKFDESIEEALDSASEGQSPSGALKDAAKDINDMLKLKAPNGLFPVPKK